MDPQDFDEDGGGGLDRRTVIRRGAILGGALVWTTPVVQSIAGPAFATGTPCVPMAILGIDHTKPPDGDFTDRGDWCIGTFTFVGANCCACVTANGRDATAVARCTATHQCTPHFAAGVC